MEVGQINLVVYIGLHGLKFLRFFTPARISMRSLIWGIPFWRMDIVMGWMRDRYRGTLGQAWGDVGLCANWPFFVLMVSVTTLQRQDLLKN